MNAPQRSRCSVARKLKADWSSSRSTAAKYSLTTSPTWRGCCSTRLAAAMAPAVPARSARVSRYFAQCRSTPRLYASPARMRALRGSWLRQHVPAHPRACRRVSGHNEYALGPSKGRYNPTALRSAQAERGQPHRPECSTRRQKLRREASLESLSGVDCGTLRNAPSGEGSIQRGGVCIGGCSK